MCELLRCASGRLDHLSSPWQQQIVDKAGDCRQPTVGNADLGKRVSFVSRRRRRLFPEPLVGAVYRNGAESVGL
jgi:hypothetical protein